MKDLTAKDFEEHIGLQITIDNAHDDLEPHILTISSVETMMETDEERRDPFAVCFTGSAMIDSAGEQAMQGSFTVQGGPLDGEEVFVTVNGHADNDVESYEYEAIFG